MQGYYSVRVVNSAGEVLSTAVMLTINDPPVITLNPGNVRAIPGRTVTLSIEAIGTAVCSCFLIFHFFSCCGSRLRMSGSSIATILGAATLHHWERRR